MEGALSNLRQSLIQFSRPRKLLNEKFRRLVDIGSSGGSADTTNPAVDPSRQWQAGYFDPMRFASQQTAISQFSVPFPAAAAASFTQDSLVGSIGGGLITQSQTASVRNAVGNGVGLSQLTGASQYSFITDDFQSQAGGDLMFSSQDPAAFHSQGFTEY
jgi:hypothetical protein